MYYKKDGQVMRSGFGFGGVRENFGLDLGSFSWLTIGLSIFAIIVVLWLFLTMRSKF